MKLYYAGQSSHGSDSSLGFANDWDVYAFDSKKMRDEWVASSRNISCRSLKRGEVIPRLRQATMRGDELYEPRPYTSEHWGIVDQSGCYPSWPNGAIGVVIVVRDDWDIQNEVKRFYS